MDSAESRARLQAALAGDFTLERELGRGGMATVYLAHDLKHDRPVALKVVHPEIAHSLGRERFTREIRLAARLQHPHILSVYDSGDTASGQLWFTRRRDSIRVRSASRWSLAEHTSGSAASPTRGCFWTVP